MRARVLSMLAAAALAGIPAMAQAETNETGQQLFRRHCGMCHLQGGTGTFMLSRRLGEEQALLESRTDLPAELVRHAVRYGIVSMPRFSRAELPDAELELIADYLSGPKETP